MDLLGALNFIRNVSDESLHTHATQTILTLKEIGKRLQFNLIPSPSSVVATPLCIESDGSRPPTNSAVHTANNLCPSPSESLSASTSQAHSPIHETQDPLEQIAPATEKLEGKNQGKKLGTLKSLLRGIQRETWWLLEARQLEDDFILSRKRKMGEDIRWQHIAIPEGVRSNDPVSKLRRVLALRSVGQEYQNKQEKNGISPTRLEELYNHLSSPETSTLNLNANHTVKEKFQTRSLHCGLRHLLIEKALNALLAKKGLVGTYLVLSAFECLEEGLYKSNGGRIEEEKKAGTTLIDYTKLLSAKGPTDGFTVAEKATTRKFIEDARYGLSTRALRIGKGDYTRLYNLENPEVIERLKNYSVLEFGVDKSAFTFLLPKNDTLFVCSIILVREGDFLGIFTSYISFSTDVSVTYGIRGPVDNL
ncbi:hypothetical protein N7539_000047 [Penicillium diatomitis]|uniref:Uncharacterized protein n=1 Tax=Penicillium diatomitis TaxID=2819901 RepID=A0A9W9XKY1_9EURO|nr:uncharacterized protein N7539_000047 [Penicillium diatomitis]KAJ5494931.1 hypothetical protein N7539_000047 [Penicillium diatomitis]